MADTQMKSLSPWHQDRPKTQSEPFYERSPQSYMGMARSYVRMVLSRCWRVEEEAATISGMKRTTLPQCAPATDTISYAGYRFPPDVISYAVWLYYRFPLSLRMVEELLAARGIDLTYETVRRWSVKFGLGIARRIRATAWREATSGTSMKWSSRSMAGSTGCGVRWTSTARCSTCWCKAGATGTRPGA